MDESLSDVIARLLAESDDRALSLERTYTALRDMDLLSKTRVHRYMCKRGCQVAQAHKVGGIVMLVVRDYKYSAGMNSAESVPEARRKNTLDGDRHWPSHVYDMTEMATWGDDAAAHVVCRHFRGALTGSRVLADADGVIPGRDGKPSTLGTPT
ncbi:hypothetical protein H9633_10180 [Microbacterium sp. Re1]|uniref:Uncharacterized protein n=1 Tax=Microbacterium commune TaxID=2762219 RepID=A0ABR8W6N5_9MICO|nr:hypothetical protein [Microbacterium commune]MBD8012664.1 hypothetical protein [Microbacterium commune]